MISIQKLSSEFQLLQHDTSLFSSETEARVNELWQAALSTSNSRLFNGLVFSADTVKPDCISGSFVEYRYLIAQRMDPRLKQVLNINPVSVMGFLSCKDGVLFGKRPEWVATRPNEWGFLPSSYIKPDVFSHDGCLDYVKSFLVELKNELNIEAQDLNDFSHHSLVVERTLEGDHYALVMKADVALSVFSIKNAHLNASEDEYADVVAVHPYELDTFMADKTGRDISIASSLLADEGYLALESDCA